MLTIKVQHILCFAPHRACGFSALSQAASTLPNYIPNLIKNLFQKKALFSELPQKGYVQDSCGASVRA